MPEPTNPSVFSCPADFTEDEVITAFVKFTMLRCQGNKTKAARLLGIDRRSLYRRLALKEVPHVDATGDRSGNE